MSLEDMIYIEGWGEECIVCGKDVSGNRGFAHLQSNGDMIALCSPLCLEMYEKNPVYYLTRMKTRELLHGARHVSTTNN